MANTAVSALMQAAIRRSLITRERAVELGHALAGCGVEVERLRAALAQLDAPEALMLQELLPAPDLPRVGPYLRLARMGEGRTGSTWLGLGPGVGGPYVVPLVLKVIHAHRLAPGPAVEAFVAEMRPLLNADHRYLVGYLDVLVSEDGRACLVEEYVAGRDLAARSQTKGPMHEVKALPILRQVAKGLHMLGRLGTCHGILHPGNVLLDANNRARLSDWGLAWSSAAKALRPGWDARTLQLHAWASPQALAMPPRGDLVADIYSAGCLAYWLLTGHLPFQGNADQQALEHAGAPRPDVRTHAPWVSERTAKTVLKAMAVVPAGRFKVPGELAVSLQKDFDIITGSTGGGSTLLQPQPAPAVAPIAVPIDAPEDAEVEARIAPPARRSDESVDLAPDEV